MHYAARLLQVRIQHRRRKGHDKCSSKQTIAIVPMSMMPMDALAPSRGRAALYDLPPQSWERQVAVCWRHAQLP